jgi:hypothetical protein
MKVQIAFDTEKTQLLTWQAPFPSTTECVYCKRQARLAFVAHEGLVKADYSARKKIPRVWSVWETDGKSNLWLHDCCAVAVYFCRKCLKPTALYNQA